LKGGWGANQTGPLPPAAPPRHAPRSTPKSPLPHRPAISSDPAPLPPRDAAQVVEHWDIFPGDGCAYYTVRPPWVAQPKVEAFFTLHPEERDLQTLLQHRQAEPPAPKASAKGRNWRGVVR